MGVVTIISLKFSDEKFMGIIEFDQEPLSLILQIGNRFGGRRFSQCLVSFLVDQNIAGKIIFGVEIEVPEYEGVVTTPLVSRETPQYYVIVLKINFYLLILHNNFLRGI